MAWNGTLLEWGDGASFTGAANSDVTPDFELLGGKYALVTKSTGTPSATLNIKVQSGGYVACGAAVTTYGTFDLPAGTYQMVMGATAGTAEGALLRVPYRGTTS